MTFEQLHFAIGAFFPFVLAIVFYDKKYIFYAPFVMSLAGIFAFTPHFFGWTGVWTNIFFFYGIIQSIFSRGQFIGYALIFIMFTVVLSLQAFYLFRGERNV